MTESSGDLLTDLVYNVSKVFTAILNTIITCLSWRTVWGKGFKQFAKIIAIFFKKTRFP